MSVFFSYKKKRLILTCWHQTRVGPLGLWFPSSTTMIVSATKLSHSVFRWYCSVAPEEVCCSTNRKTASANPARANTEFPCTDGLPLQKRDNKKTKMAIFFSFLKSKLKAMILLGCFSSRGYLSQKTWKRGTTTYMRRFAASAAFME